MKEFLIRKYLAEMEHATALLKMNAANADRELHQFGEWRTDHTTQAEIINEKFLTTLVELDNLIKK